ncbi:MAG: hypothetical protein J3Q66DRAFT_328746 [Benniella sp.]|nr:MAG: hypothetical protein J3Q66DRAFT_328746 [Benniella sp.]
MTRQLAQTRLDESKIEVIVKPAKTKPVTEGNMDRQIQAATARALCEQDPVRKQHAEVVLNLLKSIDELMADHKKKVAVWKEVQVREQAGISATRNGSSVARGNFSVHNQEQIRTVSSYLSSRAPSQPSPLHQDLSRSNGPDYSRLHESLADPNLGETRTSSYSDMPVLYPSSDVRPAEEEPFELTEEERRYIEEDNARIAAARESFQYVHV